MSDSVYNQARQHTTVGMEVAEYARLVPEHIATQSLNGQPSYAELNAQANQLARYLREALSIPTATCA